MQSTQRTTVVGDPVRMVSVLGAVALALVMAHVLLLWCRIQRGNVHVFGLARTFDLNEEGNVPSFYSALILLLCALLLGLIARCRKQIHDPLARHWTVLAMIFLYLSIDEASGLHELVSMNIKRFVDTGWLFYPWVVPAAIGFVVFIAAFARFAAQLPRRTRRLFIIATAIYFAGAIGTELIGGWHHALYGNQTAGYGLLVALEEGLEMTGVLVLVFALLDYARVSGCELLITMRPPDTVNEGISHAKSQSREES